MYTDAVLQYAHMRAVQQVNLQIPVYVQVLSRKIAFMTEWIDNE